MRFKTLKEIGSASGRKVSSLLRMGGRRSSFVLQGKGVSSFRIRREGKVEFMWRSALDRDLGGEG